MATFGEQVIQFYRTLEPPEGLPQDIEILNPFREARVEEIVQKFYARFFSDADPRVFVVGINPGRIGSGVTGIPFTDPIILREFYGMETTLDLRQELSATFIHEFITHFGGPEDFYKHFYFTSVSPLGFVKEKKNFNYYDDRDIFEKLKPYMVEKLRTQIAFGAKKKAILLGTGKNQQIFQDLNNEFHFFDEVLVLPHPRYVMQYKKKEIEKYLAEYERAFCEALQ